MRISLFNFILPLLNHSEWTNENTIELCPPPFFFHFNEKMFCFVCFFRRLLPTQNLPQTSANLYAFPPKKKEKERKHQKERHKQRNITITRQSSLIPKEYKQMRVKCTVHSSYENKIWTTISRIHLFLASNVTLWELHCAVTALPRSRTVTVEC